MAGVFKFKAIKPAKFKDAEIKRLIRNAVFRIGRGVLRDFQATVATWEEKPQFSLLTSVRLGSDVGFFVGTDDQIYNWVTHGTPEHIIPVGDAGVLTIPQDYTPKTEVGIIGSRTGGESGDINLIPFDVLHPGIEARNFEDVIAEKWDKRWKRAIQDAVKEGIRLSGHAM